MHRFLRLRASEWVLLAYFGYVVLIAPFFPERPHLGFQPLWTLLAVFLLLACCSRLENGAWAEAVSRVRDWLPVVLTLAAFREMEAFLPVRYDHGYESSWIRWDRLLLERCHFRGIIESLGILLPAYLELCYFFVYGVAAFGVAVLWKQNRRKYVSLFLTIYLIGTLCAYALFPYFPSRPPRLIFPEVAPPHISSWFRELNLYVLRHATIHVGVFPSAHVSSAFSAAFGMFFVLPDKKRFGWGLLIYAISVAVATIYGRYHYAADVIAGIGISLIAGLLCLTLRPLVKKSAAQPIPTVSDLLPK